ncbi:MAG: hypothetical protein N3A64_03235, partial [Desulfobacterota bacterium]|nr:hypothetical protein [Thermodesulfobacteriota bacterium]
MIRLLLNPKRKIIRSKVKKVKEELKRRFSVYQTANLQGIQPKEFYSYIQSRIGIIDAQVEGYCDKELDRQRDSSIKFYWGHNHNFGEFKLKGMMG